MMTHDRREFLGLILGGAAVAASPLTSPTPTQPAAVRLARLANASAQDDEAFWQLVKHEFPVRPGLAMMNAANLCPSPFVVIDAVARLTRDVDADASFQNRGKFGALRQAARERLANHLGADAGEIAITRNTSEGNNTVVHGVTLDRGDEVVIWDQNHPTNNVSWEVQAERTGFTVTKVATPTAPESEDELVEVFARAMTPRTKVLAFSHVSNVTGVRLPARQLCQLARSRGVLTLVDGAQTFGAIRVNVHDMGCDFYTGSSHKWFVGPKEAGVLYVREDQIADLWANDVGVGWQGAVRNGAQKFENLGQRDDACVAAMGTAQEFHATIGIDRIDARVRALATALMEGLRERIPGVTFATPWHPDLRAGVVIFSPPGVDTGDLYSRLYAEHHIAGARQAAGMRLSVHLYNTMEEVDRAVEAVATIAG
jgi:selenocysteine lyase/cysteine desulfurase